MDKVKEIMRKQRKTGFASSTGKLSGSRSSGNMHEDEDDLSDDAMDFMTMLRTSSSTSQVPSNVPSTTLSPPSPTLRGSGGKPSPANMRTIHSQPLPLAADPTAYFPTRSSNEISYFGLSTESSVSSGGSSGGSGGSGEESGSSSQDDNSKAGFDNEDEVDIFEFLKTGKTGGKTSPTSESRASSKTQPDDDDDLDLMSFLKGSEPSKPRTSKAAKPVISVGEVLGKIKKEPLRKDTFASVSTPSLSPSPTDLGSPLRIAMSSVGLPPTGGLNSPNSIVSLFPPLESYTTAMPGEKSLDVDLINGWISRYGGSYNITKPPAKFPVKTKARLMSRQKLTLISGNLLLTTYRVTFVPKTTGLGDETVSIAYRSIARVRVTRSLEEEFSSDVLMEEEKKPEEEEEEEDTAGTAGKGDKVSPLDFLLSSTPPPEAEKLSFSDFLNELERDKAATSRTSSTGLISSTSSNRTSSSFDRRAASVASPKEWKNKLKRVGFNHRSSKGTSKESLSTSTVSKGDPSRASSSALPSPKDMPGCFLVIYGHEVRREILYFTSESTAQLLQQTISSAAQTFSTVCSGLANIDTNVRVTKDLPCFEFASCMPTVDPALKRAYSLEEDQREMNLRIVSDPEAEIPRFSTKWGICENTNYFIRDYGPSLVMPKTITTSDLRCLVAARIYYRGRIPLPLFVHPTSGGILSKSGGFYTSGFRVGSNPNPLPTTLLPEFLINRRLLLELSGNRLLSESECAKLTTMNDDAVLFNKLQIFLLSSDPSAPNSVSDDLKAAINVNFVKVPSVGQILDSYHDLRLQCLQARPWRLQPASKSRGNSVVPTPQPASRKSASISVSHGYQTVHVSASVSALSTTSGSGPSSGPGSGSSVRGRTTTSSGPAATWASTGMVPWMAGIENGTWRAFQSQALTTAVDICNTLVAGTSVLLVPYLSSLQKQTLRSTIGGGAQSSTEESFFDWPSIIGSLSQLLVVTNSRTIRGFLSMVEKDWLMYGHNFVDLTADHSASSKIRQKRTLSKRSPIAFSLFIDCVAQLIQQFPASFEFTDSFLIALLDEFYFSRFGTFLCSTHIERDKWQIDGKTIPLWAFVSENRSEFLNPYYEKTTKTLQPLTTPTSLGLWSNYLLRYVTSSKLFASSKTIQQLSSTSNSLNLGGACLGYLPKRFLQTVSHIHHLDLSRNGLVVFPLELLELSHLTKMVFNNNYIKHLPEELLLIMAKKFPKLKRFSFSENRMHSCGSFAPLTTLKKILIDNNKLPAIPALPNGLELLQVNENPFASIEVLQKCLPTMSRLKVLDVSSLSLSEFPLQICSLGSLETLYINRNNLQAFPTELAQLKKLRKLYFNHNKFTSLPTVLFSISSLTEIHGSNCKMSEVGSGIKKLNSLRLLNLAANKLQAVPPALLLLSNLVSLDLSDNGITSIPSGISSLTNLEELSLQQNQVVTLPPDIGLLKKLRSLDVSNNSLVYLVPEIGTIPDLNNFKLSGNNLKTPPQEVISRGHRAIMEFLRSLCGQDAKPCYRMKLMIVGQENTGKTSLLKRLRKTTDIKTKDPVLSATPSSNSYNISTDGISVSELYVTFKFKNEEKKVVQFNTWDFAGQEVYYTTHQFFLSDGALILLVYNLEIPDDSSRLEFWLRSIKGRSPSSVVILVGTHADAVGKSTGHALATALFQKWKPHFPKLGGSIAVSCIRGGLGFDKLWHAIESATNDFSSMGELIPTRYFQLEEIVKSESTKRLPPIISKDELIKMGSLVMINEAELDYVTTILQRFGALFYWGNDPMLENIVVIDPSWLVAISSSLFTTKHTYCKNGVVNHSSLRDIWRPPQFPAKIHKTMMDILQRFQVAFCLTPNAEDFYSGMSLVPSLLPEERPSTIEASFPVFTDDEFCRRIFKFQFLPYGIFGRLMVRILSATKHAPSVVWRNGMLMKTTSRLILVEQLTAQRKIQISIRGKSASKLFSFCVESLESLTKWYNVASIIEIPCIHCYRRRLYDPYMFLLREIENALETGVSMVYCRGIRPVRIDLLAPDLSLATLRDHKINFSDIAIEKKIGEGGFAFVYKGTYRQESVAVKQIKISESEEESVFAEFRREVWAMSGLRHENVVRLIGFCLSPACIISEFISNGNLYEYIYNKALPLEMPFLLRVATDIAKGLRFLHLTITPPVIHSDLKSPNILLSSLDVTSEVVAKITDFGLSVRAHMDKGRFLGNPIWLAPEVLRNQEFNNKVDIYAYGIIIWELATREYFFGDEDFMSQIQVKVLAGVRPNIDDNTPKQIKEIVNSCWANDPAQRPEITTCLELLKTAMEEFAPNLVDLAFSEREIVPQAVNPKQNVMDIEDEFNTSFTAHEPSRLLETKFDGSIQCLASSPRTEKVWCGDSTGTITILNHDGEEHVKEQCHDNKVYCIVEIDSVMWSCSSDSTIRVWNTDLACLKEIKSINALTLLRAEVNYVWAALTDYTIAVINITTMKEERKIALKEGSVSPDLDVIGCMLVVKDHIWVGTSHGIKRIDKATHKVLDTLSGHQKIIHKLVSVGQHEIWSCSSDNTIRIWDASGRCLQVLSGHTARVFDLLPENSQRGVVWSCSWDKSIFIWDVKTRRFAGECQVTHNDAVSSLVQVGGMVWSGSWDRRIAVWQTLGLQDFLRAIQTSDFEAVARLVQTPKAFFTLKNQLPTSTVRIGDKHNRDPRGVFRGKCNHKGCDCLLYEYNPARGYGCDYCGCPPAKHTQETKD